MPKPSIARRAEYLSMNRLLGRHDGPGEAAWREAMRAKVEGQVRRPLAANVLRLSDKLSLAGAVRKLIAILGEADCPIELLLIEAQDTPDRIRRELQEGTLADLLKGLKMRNVRVLMRPSRASTKFGRAELNLSDPDKAAEIWSLRGQISVQNLETSGTRKPRWLDRRHSADQFDLDGVWTVWTALRMYFDGDSTEGIAAAFNRANNESPSSRPYPQVRAMAKGWTAEHVRQLLLPDTERLSAGTKTHGSELVDRLNIIDFDVHQVLVDAYGKRAKANRGAPARRELLFKGIPIECRCGRPLNADPSSHKPERCARPGCPVNGKTPADIEAMARQAVACHLAQNQLLVWELENPFPDDRHTVQQVAAEMNREIREGKGFEELRVLMNRVHQRRTGNKRLRKSQLDRALQLLSCQADRQGQQSSNTEVVELRRLRLAILRRVERITIASDGEVASLRAFPGGVLKAEKASSLSVDKRPHRQDRVDAKKARKTRGSAVNHPVTIPLEETFSIVNRAGPNYSHWESIVEEELTSVELHTVGLGPGMPSRRRVKSSSQEMLAWVRRLQECMGQHRLKKIVLLEFESVAGSDDRRTDTGWLGSYEHSNAQIILYVGAIIRVAEELGCSARTIGRIVLKHELGHHAAPGSAEEKNQYRSFSTNEATCRAETAAQLFAWYTSNVNDREVMRTRLNRYPSDAYRVYEEILRFSQGELNPRNGEIGGDIRAGWINAWQLAQFQNKVLLIVSRVHAPDHLALISSALASLKDRARTLYPSLDYWSMISAASQGSPCLARNRTGGEVSLFANFGSHSMLLLEVGDIPVRENSRTWNSHHCKHLSSETIAIVDRKNSERGWVAVSLRVASRKLDEENRKFLIESLVEEFATAGRLPAA